VVKEDHSSRWGQKVLKNKKEGAVGQVVCFVNWRGREETVPKRKGKNQKTLLMWVGKEKVP